MLSKCANPKCTATLRYLHQGRLFVASPRNTVVTSESRIDYKWLCDGCCRSMTIMDGGAIHRFRRSWFRNSTNANGLDRRLLA
jgi:hypothetical protein